MATKLTGHSDDLIELDGDIREEWPPINGDDDSAIIVFSDGTVLRIEYSNEGIWRITALNVGDGFAGIDVNPLTDDDRYSDVATVEGAKWAVLGMSIAQAKS